jgi:hypothetical protein
MKFKNIWKGGMKKSLWRNPIGALVGAVLAGIGWEIGAGIYHSLKGKKPAEKDRQAAEEE